MQTVKVRYLPENRSMLFLRENFSRHLWVTAEHLWYKNNHLHKEYSGFDNFCDYAFVVETEKGSGR